jgi:hypothetical protein
MRKVVGDLPGSGAIPPTGTPTSKRCNSRRFDTVVLLAVQLEAGVDRTGTCKSLCTQALARSRAPKCNGCWNRQRTFECRDGRRQFDLDVDLYLDVHVDVRVVHRVDHHVDHHRGRVAATVACPPTNAQEPRTCP